jgi:hypothetical protein
MERGIIVNRKDFPKSYNEKDSGLSPQPPSSVHAAGTTAQKDLPSLPPSDRISTHTSDPKCVTKLPIAAAGEAAWQNPARRRSSLITTLMKRQPTESTMQLLQTKQLKRESQSLHVKKENKIQSFIRRASSYIPLSPKSQSQEGRVITEK